MFSAEAGKEGDILHNISNMLPSTGSMPWTGTTIACLIFIFNLQYTESFGLNQTTLLMDIAIFEV